ncbi:MAG: flavodoxin family protein [Candidatus Pacebacteria bacterium]|nr:flavodoxin family protein [Candidatus Paceibacterota bacterium]
MKIVAVCGSPRKGNTEFILKRVLTQAEKSEINTDLILLRNQRIEFCDGCLSCDSSFVCNKRDDMQMVCSKLEDADLIIFGSPTYFDNVTGMMKNFIDRLNIYVENKKLRDKKVAIINVGQDISVNNKVVKYFELLPGCLEFVIVGDLSLIAKDYQDIENDNEKIAKIDEFTKNIIGQN